jgi:pyrimidine deaminase RibD-like protein
MKDPNPLVAAEVLRGWRAGIRVRVGLLEAECRQLNEAFVKTITRRVAFCDPQAGRDSDAK